MMRRFGRRWIVGTCATRISAAGPYGGGDDFVIIYLEKKSSPLKKGLNILCDTQNHTKAPLELVTNSDKQLVYRELP